MKYTVILLRQAEKYYKKLQWKFKAQVQEYLTSLEAEAFLGKRLHGDLKDYCSLRVGRRLRIIYSISEKDKTVHVVAVGPRETIYQ